MTKALQSAVPTRPEESQFRLGDPPRMRAQDIDVPGLREAARRLLELMDEVFVAVPRTTSERWSRFPNHAHSGVPATGLLGDR